MIVKIEKCEKEQKKRLYEGNKKKNKRKKKRVEICKEKHAKLFIWG